eukprot:360913-Chlamydomonas_euryale.AAC.6
MYRCLRIPPPTHTHTRNSKLCAAHAAIAHANSLLCAEAYLCYVTVQRQLLVWRGVLPVGVEVAPNTCGPLAVWGLRAPVVAANKVGNKLRTSSAIKLFLGRPPENSEGASNCGFSMT